MSGPSPTCEERQIASAEEWGLLKTTAVTWDGWDHTEHKVPPKEYWGNHRLEVRSGDVLVTKAGPRHRVGVVVYVDETPPHLMVSGKMICLRPDHAKVNYKILAAALSQREPQRFLDGRTTGMADSQLNFTNELLLNTIVKLPPKPEQNKIAEILSTIDSAIQQTEALIAKQERVKSGLMQDLLTRGVNEQGEVRSEQTHKFKDSALGRIPVNWEVTSLEQLTNQIVDGVHHTPTYVESGVPFIVITDLTGSSEINFSNTRFVTVRDHLEFSKRARPRPGDVLVTKDGTLGVARIVPADAPEFSIFVSVAMLRPKANLCLPELIWAFFESGDFLIQLGALSAGTGLTHIHLEHFRKFLLRYPPIGEQIQIFRVINSQQDALNKMVSELRKLNNHKTGLMRDLLTVRPRSPPY
jgi:type I restriction enzyme S subunit